MERAGAKQLRLIVNRRAFSLTRQKRDRRMVLNRCAVTFAFEQGAEVVDETCRLFRHAVISTYPYLHFVVGDRMPFDSMDIDTFDQIDGGGFRFGLFAAIHGSQKSSTRQPPVPVVVGATRPSILRLAVPIKRVLPHSATAAAPVCGCDRVGHVVSLLMRGGALRLSSALSSPDGASSPPVGCTFI